MTYAELAEYISNLTDEQKQMDVTVLVRGVDEYYPLNDEYPVAESGNLTEVLDIGTPYLII